MHGAILNADCIWRLFWPYYNVDYIMCSDSNHVHRAHDALCNSTNSSENARHWLCTLHSRIRCAFFFNVNINNVTAALPFSACILQSAAGPADATNADLWFVIRWSPKVRWSLLPDVWSRAGGEDARKHGVWGEGRMQDAYSGSNARFYMIPDWMRSCITESRACRSHAARCCDVTAG